MVLEQLFHCVWVMLLENVGTVNIHGSYEIVYYGMDADATNCQEYREDDNDDMTRDIS